MNPSIHRARGAALVTALVLLIIITSLALAATRSSSLELRMASNASDRAAVAQAALGIAESISASPNSTPVIGSLGTRICSAAAPETGIAVCDPGFVGSLNIPADADPCSPGGCEGQESRWVGVERTSTDARPPPRGIGSSVANFGAADFRIHARYIDANGNRADAYEGVMVLVPKSGGN